MTPEPNAPCACGSGLTAAHCCAFDLAAALSSRREAPPPPAPPEPLLLQGAKAALENKKTGKATKLLLRVLEADPLQLEALRLLLEIRRGEDNKPAVAALLRRVVALDSNDFASTNALAMLELGRGDPAAAEPLARMAVRIAPQNPQSHNLMAMAMTEQHRAVVGEYHCRQALALSSKRIPLVVANLATNLFNQGRIAEARALFQEADEAAPHNRQTLMAWARLEEADRKLDAALAILDQLDKLAANDPSVALMRATILRREKRYDDALALLDDSPGRRSRPLRPIERIERGRLLDQMGRYDEAWADFAGGKARIAQLSGNTYAEAGATQMGERLKRMFAKAPLSMMPYTTARTDVPQPIFILGFPRSGTTLLEQTLTGSADISAGDELPLIHQLAAVMPKLLDSPLAYPEALSDLWMGDHREGLDELRDVYLQRARQLGAMEEGARWFTDKMPLNEMNLGLIALVFPQAPLIHVMRHPLDIMVSAMSNVFTHGAYCSSALESAAKHLLLSHDLVEHYRREMALNYTLVRYEDVVDDQAVTIERVFGFIGAPFDPAVLTFERNARYARTASYQQVTERLYDSSRYRYRNYLPHLQPVVEMLRPLIERHGYTVEAAT